MQMNDGQNKRNDRLREINLKIGISTQYAIHPH